MEIASDVMARVPRWVRWATVLCWMGVLFYLSSLTGTSMPGRFASLAHFLAYAVLGALAWAALDDPRGTARCIALAVLISSAYGITDEIHQAFVPGRTPDVTDWGFDTIGAFVGAVLLAAIASGGTRRRPPM